MIRSLVICALMLGAGSVAEAHPASKMSLEYDRTKNELNIEVTHKVKNPATHFIDTLTIYVNGERINKVDIREQTDEDGLQFFLKVPELQTGDEVKVVSHSKHGGTKSSEITIP